MKQLNTRHRASMGKMALRRCLIGMLYVGLILMVGVGKVSAADTGSDILVIHSYHPTFSWVVDIDTAIRSVLNTDGKTARFFYMDSKRQPGEDSKNRMATQGKRLIETTGARVVIAVDDNAQTYIVSDLKQKPNVQFVFCGVNAEPSQYGYPAKNVTGILERSYAAQTLRLLTTLIPATRSFAVISDGSPSSDSVVGRLVAKSKAGQLPLPLISVQRPDSLAQWRKAVRQMDADPSVGAIMVPLYHTVHVDTPGKSAPSFDVMQWTVKATRKPVVGMWPHAVENGALLAVVVDPKEHGQTAARMAVAILNGKRAADIPMETNQDGYVMVNLLNSDHLALDATINIDQIADRVLK